MSLAAPSLRVNKPFISPSQMETFAKKAEMKMTTAAYGSISSIGDIQKTVNNMWKSDRPNILIRLLDKLFNNSHRQIATDLLMVLNIATCCKAYQRNVLQTMQNNGAKGCDLQAAVNQVSEEFAAALRNLDWTFPGIFSNDMPTTELWAGSAFLKLYEYTTNKNDFLKIFHRDARLEETPPGSSQYALKCKCKIVIPPDKNDRNNNGQEKSWGFNFTIPDVLHCNFLSQDELTSLATGAFSDISKSYDRVLNKFVDIRNDRLRIKDGLDYFRRHYMATTNILDKKVEEVTDAIAQSPQILHAIENNILGYDIRNYEYKDDISAEPTSLTSEKLQETSFNLKYDSEKINPLKKQYKSIISIEKRAAEYVMETAKKYVRMMEFCRENSIINYESHNAEMSETHQNLLITHLSNHYSPEDFVEETSMLVNHAENLQARFEETEVNDSLDKILSDIELKKTTLPPWDNSLNNLINYHSQLKNTARSYNELKEATEKYNDELDILHNPLYDMMANIFVDGFDVETQAQKTFRAKINQLEKFYHFTTALNEIKNSNHKSLFSDYIKKHDEAAKILFPEGINNFGFIDSARLDNKINDINRRLIEKNKECATDNYSSIAEFIDSYELIRDNNCSDDKRQEQYKKDEEKFVEPYKNTFANLSQKVKEHHDRLARKTSPEIEKIKAQRQAKYLREKGINPLKHASSKLLDGNDIPRIIPHQEMSYSSNRIYDPVALQHTQENSDYTVPGYLLNRNDALSNSLDEVRNAIADPIERVDYSLADAPPRERYSPSGPSPRENNPFPGAIGMADNAQPPNYASIFPHSPTSNATNTFPGPTENTEIDEIDVSIDEEIDEESVYEYYEEDPSETITASTNRDDDPLTGMLQSARNDQIATTRNRNLNADLQRQAQPVIEIQQTTTPDRRLQRVDDDDNDGISPRLKRLYKLFES